MYYFRFTVCGTGDNQVRIISLGAGPEEKRQVSHSQDITCLVVTPDSQSLITGSRDMSLKVWQLAGGKLSQVNNRSKIFDMRSCGFCKIYKVTIIL